MCEKINYIAPLMIIQVSKFSITEVKCSKFRFFTGLSYKTDIECCLRIGPCNKDWKSYLQTYYVYMIPQCINKNLGISCEKLPIDHNKWASLLQKAFTNILKEAG